MITEETSMKKNLRMMMRVTDWEIVVTVTTIKLVVFFSNITINKPDAKL